MISPKEIIETFSYSKDEQDAFPYLALYMKSVVGKLPCIENERDKMRTYALAGLFLTYRTFSHTGDVMTTDMGDITSEYIHNKRLGLYKQYFGSEIRNELHYLTLMKLTSLKFILMALASKFFR